MDFCYGDLSNVNFGILMKASAFEIFVKLSRMVVANSSELSRFGVQALQDLQSGK